MSLPPSSATPDAAPPSHESADLPRPMPRAVRALVAVALLAGAIAVPFVLGSRYYLGIAHQVLIFIILASGYNILLGYTGLVSLGHIALFAIGAYASAIIVVDLGVPFVFGLPLAAAVATLAGVLVAVPALRIKGHYLTLLTLALGEAVRLVLRNLDWLTGGSNGFAGIPRPSLFGLTAKSAFSLYFVLLAFAVVAVVFVWGLERSRFGRAFKAIRDAEIGAEVSGVDTARMKVIAFAISAAYAGVAGSLYAHTMRFISPEFFSLGLTITLLAMVLIGGRGTVLGPVLAAILLTTAPEAFRFLKEYYLILFGLMIYLCVLFLPEGLAGLLGRIRWPRRARSAGGGR